MKNLGLFFSLVILFSSAAFSVNLEPICYDNPSDFPGKRVCIQQIESGRAYSFPPVQIEGQWVRLSGTLLGVTQYSGKDVREVMGGKNQTIFHNFHGAYAKIQYHIEPLTGNRLPDSLIAQEVLTIVRSNYECKVNPPHNAQVMGGSYWDQISTGSEGASWPLEAACAVVQNISINGVPVGDIIWILSPGKKEIVAKKREIISSISANGVSVIPGSK